MYKFIVNPTNKRIININSREGAQLLNKYLSYFMTRGGGITMNAPQLWNSLPWEPRVVAPEMFDNRFRLPILGIRNFVNLTDESKQKFKILLLMLSNILEPSISKDTITGLYVNKNNKNEVIYISEGDLLLKHDLSEETNISRFGEYEYARKDSAVVLQEDDYNEFIESENYQELNSVMASMEYEENQKDL